MKNHLLVAASVTTLLLTACGGGGGGNNTPRATTKSDVNVAARSNGATAMALYNPATANNLIDGDTSTTWISDPESPILITFANTENIKKIKLSRSAASASAGSSPDILIELSADGLTYKPSNLSVVNGGIACSSMTSNTQSMECNMTELPTKFVRITTKNGKSFEFREFEAIAYK